MMGRGWVAPGPCGIMPSMWVQALVAAILASSAQPQPREQPHPRLFLDAARLATLRRSEATAPLFEAVMVQADAAVRAPPIRYNFEVPRCSQPGTCLAAGPLNGTTGSLSPHPLPPVGPLDTLGVLRRVATLAMAHRMQTDTHRRSPYLLAALRQLRLTTSWPSWYWPTGQAQQLAFGMWAVAVGYDWLHPALTSSERAELRQGLLQRGVLAARAAAHEAPWWRRDNVSSAGLAVFSSTLAACTALEGDFRGNSTVQAVLAAACRDARAGAARNIGSFAPHGVWPESAAQLALAAESTALAHLADPATAVGEGIPEAIGRYQLSSTGPSFLAHNWGDGPPELAHSPAVLLWAARAANRPAFAYAARSQLRHVPVPTAADSLPGDVLSLIFFSEAGDKAALAEQPTEIVLVDPSEADKTRGRKTHLGSFRQCWNCANASWAAFKAGRNHYQDNAASHNNHGQLDLGSWVLEMKGQRWAVRATRQISRLAHSPTA